MDRTTLTFLIDAYERETSVDPNGKETERTVLRFHPCDRAGAGRRSFRWRATSPSWSSARERSKRALRPQFRTQYDEGNIGQLYRRQDEIGTPFCVTVDYETLDDGTVTVRERDSMRQERVAGRSARRRYLREQLACDEARRISSRRGRSASDVGSRLRCAICSAARARVWPR